MTAVAADQLTTFRETVRTQLQTQLRSVYGGSFEVVSAVLTGPFEDRSVGCIWVASGEKAPEQGAQRVLFRVRIFRQWSEREPYGQDPAELEQIPDIVSNALRAIQASAGLWFFSLEGFEIDHESWGTEVAFLAWREDPFLP